MSKAGTAGGRGIVFFGAYDPDYPRNAIIRKGLARIHVPTVECRAGWRKNVLARYPSLIGRFASVRGKGPVLFVPDFRHKDIPLAWLLARLSGRRVIFDPLVSRYETKVLDRGDAGEGSAQAWHNRNIDRISLRMADLVLADTDSHARFFSREFSVPQEKVRTLYLGFDDELFPGSPLREPEGKLKILFYGSFLPLHGIETIIEAARILGGAEVAFTIVGGGQTYVSIRSLSSGMPGDLVEFVPEVAASSLAGMIAGSDIVLGVFGTTPKADMVIPNKVYQALAVGRPVITAGTAAVREIFRDGEHVMMVPAGDPGALADAILTLKGSPGLRKKLSAEGKDLVRNRYNPAKLAENLVGLMKGLNFL